MSRDIAASMITRRAGRPPATWFLPWALCTMLWLLACIAAPSAHAQGQDFSRVEIQALPLGGGLYMLTGAGGNIGLAVGDDAVFVIDDQFAPLAPKIKAAIARITAKRDHSHDHP